MTPPPKYSALKLPPKRLAEDSAQTQVSATRMPQQSLCRSQPESCSLIPLYP
jgi:hypothetical protein